MASPKTETKQLVAYDFVQLLKIKRGTSAVALERFEAQVVGRLDQLLDHCRQWPEAIDEILQHALDNSLANFRRSFRPHQRPIKSKDFSGSFVLILVVNYFKDVDDELAAQVGHVLETYLNAAGMLFDLSQNRRGTAAGLKSNIEDMRASISPFNDAVNRHSIAARLAVEVYTDNRPARYPELYQLYRAAAPVVLN